MKNFKRIEEKLTSGIEVEEEGELDKGLGHIIELSDDSEKIWKEENAAKKQKLELDTSQADKLCLNSLETFGQTKARKRSESSSEEPKKPRSSNVIGFLREKNAQKNEFHQQELDLKRQKKTENFQALMTNQQQQTYLCSNNNKLMLLF